MTSAYLTPEQHLAIADALLQPEHDTPEETVTQFAIIATAHVLTGLLQVALKETMP